MADIKHRKISVFRQITKQLHDMGLRGDIKTGGRLVKKQRFGVAGKRHCNGHPLLLATG